MTATIIYTGDLTLPAALHGHWAVAMERSSSLKVTG